MNNQVSNTEDRAEAQVATYKEAYGSSTGEIREAGKIRMLAGNLIDLTNLQLDDINIEDLAWGIGRTLRYGGHIREDYTVAHHSIIMSYLVPEEYALEALLHDAAEAYVGDIIWPVKAMFPEVEAFENTLAHKIMCKFAVQTAEVGQFTVAGGDGEGDTVPVYVKSAPVAEADYAMLQHECFGFGRPGVFNDEVEKAWLRAARIHEQWWFAPTYAFLERFDQLTGGNSLDLENLEKLWFSNDAYSDEHVARIESILAEMEGTAEPEWDEALPATSEMTDDEMGSVLEEVYQDDAVWREMQRAAQEEDRG